MFGDIEQLKNGGFEGFHKVEGLMRDGCASIPEIPGVYMVLNPNREKDFLNESVGGHFKGKNPTVHINILDSNWITDTIVLYIGQTTKQTLRKRIQQFMRFGDGKRVGHWGGRLIWQLGNNRDLLLCHQVITGQEPADVEAGLISKFKSHYGNRPFANLQG